MAHEREAASLRLALDMFATGEELMRQKLKREHPDESADQLEARIVTWLQTRPGAEHGDAEGRRGTWPRNPK